MLLQAAFVLSFIALIVFGLLLNKKEEPVIFWMFFALGSIFFLAMMTRSPKENPEHKNSTYLIGLYS